MKRKSIKKRRFNIMWIMLILSLAAIAIITLANVIIVRNTRAYVFDDVGSIPKTKVGLVLGTTKYLADGSINYYFKYRIDAAVKLYKAGKIKYIVVSGDNHRHGYNEPQLMKNDLIAAGVPGEVIYADYAGFRTLDSIVRMREIFGQNEFIIISQKFHNERAVYIAHHYDLKVYGYNARDVNHHSGLKTQVREKFARVKVFVDFITNKQPKFLGEKIEIGG